MQEKAAKWQKIKQLKLEVISKLIKVKMQNKIKCDFLRTIKIWNVLREISKKLQTTVANKHKRAIWAIFSIKIT